MNLILDKAIQGINKLTTPIPDATLPAGIEAALDYFLQVIGLFNIFLDMTTFASVINTVIVTELLLLSLIIGIKILRITRVLPEK